MTSSLNLLAMKLADPFKLSSPEFDPNIKKMLTDVLSEDQLKDFDPIENLSKSQKKAFEKFKNGDNIALLASAGTGKSFCVKQMQEYNYSRSDYSVMYLTATTGVSAYSINGMTIHSFMGFGNGDGDII